MRKPCNDCPFVKASPLNGSPEWLTDVMQFSKNNKYFEHTCHKTDPNADGYIKGKKTVECAGHLKMIMNQMDNTPGKDGIYENYSTMIERYLRKWLGDTHFESLKSKYGSLNSIHLSK